MPTVSERSYAHITNNDLRQLRDIALGSLCCFFCHRENLSHYQEKLVVIALCQGAALHYIDGENGVKDFDIFAFYRTTRLNRKLETPRRSKLERSGLAKFGVHPDENKNGHTTRHIDLFRKCITNKCITNLDVSTDLHSQEEILLAYLCGGRTKTAKKLSTKGRSRSLA